MSRQMNEFEEKALNEFNSQVIDGMIWDSEIDKWVPEEDYKDKLTVFHDTDAPSTAGSSLKGYLYGPNLFFPTDKMYRDRNQSRQQANQKKWSKKYHALLLTLEAFRAF